MKSQKRQKGQTITEFLVILVVLSAIVLLHAQLSLSYVIASYLRYTSFMAARAEAVSTDRPGSSQIYTQALIGDSTASKLRPVATLAPPEGESYVSEGHVKIGYTVLNFVPLVDTIGGGLFSRISESPISREPGPVTPKIPGAYFDNE